VYKETDLARLDSEAEHQLAHFPPIENIEKRIAAAKAFSIWLDITDPILAITALDDMLVPPSRSQALAGQLPLATLAEMKWGGHACNVTDPDTFNNLVRDFLGS
jgi:aminoacrylate hydrolase